MTMKVYIVTTKKDDVDDDHEGVYSDEKKDDVDDDNQGVHYVSNGRMFD